MGEFFAMGGYAVYVWPCYIVFFLVFGLHVVAAKLTKHRVLKDVLTQKHRNEIKNRDRKGNSK